MGYNMPKCKFKLGGWECPLEVLPGEEYCYWHLPKDGKRPTQEQLDELKEKKILAVYLKGADLLGADLQNADLSEAKLQNATLSGADLQNADLTGAELQRTNLFGAIVTPNTTLQGANLRWANLYRSYLDRTLTLRDAKIFDKNRPKEINELVADFSKRRLVIDFEKLKEVDWELAINAFNIGGCYVLEEEKLYPLIQRKASFCLRIKRKTKKHPKSRKS